MLILEPRHEFLSPGDFARFLQIIEGEVKDGMFEEILVDPDYGRGQIFGGRWFRDRQTKVIWRLVPPDFPFRGLWEPVSYEKLNPS